MVTMENSILLQAGDHALPLRSLLSLDKQSLETLLGLLLLDLPLLFTLCYRYNTKEIVHGIGEFFDGTMRHRTILGSVQDVEVGMLEPGRSDCF